MALKTKIPLTEEKGTELYTNISLSNYFKFFLKI